MEELMSELILRRAREDDFEQLLKVLHFLHSNDIPAPPEQLKSTWDQILRNETVVHYVAESEGILVAACHLVVVPNLTRGAKPYGMIENVVTRPEYRRHGIGTRLLQYVLKEAWSLDCYKVMLMTGSREAGVHQYYENAGFKPGLKAAFLAKPETET